MVSVASMEKDSLRNKNSTGVPFDDIPVSTKTFIIMSNLSLDIRALYKYLPTTDYIIIPKRRGRKKKVAAVDPNKDIKNGSIITLEFEGEFRGVLLKKKKPKTDKKRNNWFRNSITVVMIMDNKKINFKVSKNGMFQMTGCKHDLQADKCIRQMWEYIKTDNSIYTIPEGQPLSLIFIPAMRNIDFCLGFQIDREALDEYFNTHTDYYSLLETSIGYTGVNIKIPVGIPITSLILDKSVYLPEKNEWVPQKISYNDYLSLLSLKDKQKRLDKERYNTFLVFHSGRVIMSSLCEAFARDCYYEFLNIVIKNRHLFEEKLVT